MLMNIQKAFNYYDRIPFYYYYIGLKKDAGIEKLTAAEMATELGFKSSASIIKDFRALLGNKGRKSYGYNINFLYKTFSELMHMYENTCNLYIVGSKGNLFNDELLTNRGFHFCGSKDTFDIDDITSKNADIILLTQIISADEFAKLELLPISAIINITNRTFQSEYLPIYNFDITEIILNTWFKAKNTTPK